MNLKDIREAVFNQADWSPHKSDEAKSRLNRFINRAYNLISLESPFLFFEEILHIATEPDVVPPSTDTVQFVNNTPDVYSPSSWVLEQTNFATADKTWPADRSWDGRMIEIKGANGKWHRNIIRTIFVKIKLEGQEQVPIVESARMSLWRPFDTDLPAPSHAIDPPQEAVIGPGPFEYRVYTEAYHLPDDLITLNSARLWKTNNSWPLAVLGQRDAEKQNIVDTHTALAKGIPRVMFRGAHFQMMAPAEAPGVGPSPDGQAYEWEGPEPAGQFEYKITYCWGVRDPFMTLNPSPFSTVGKYRTPWSGLPAADIGAGNALEGDTQGLDQWGPQRYREPRWESAPSPVSSQAESANGGVGILLTPPNIEYMLGFYTIFDPAGAAVEPVRNYMSGWYIRVYRRRLSCDFGGYTATQRGSYNMPSPNLGGLLSDLKRIPADEPFYLLSEFHIDSTNSGQFLDNGSIIPDRTRRLRDTHGYQSIHLYPVPNERYELQLRCVRRPLELINDTDVPLIHAEACDVLIDRTLQLLYETEGNVVMMRFAKDRYDRNLKDLAKRYGDLRSAAQPMLKRLSRASPGYRSQMRYRQWWTTATD